MKILTIYLLQILSTYIITVWPLYKIFQCFASPNRSVRDDAALNALRARVCLVRLAAVPRAGRRNIVVSVCLADKLRGEYGARAVETLDSPLPQGRAIVTVAAAVHRESRREVIAE